MKTLTEEQKLEAVEKALDRREPIAYLSFCCTNDENAGPFHHTCGVVHDLPILKLSDVITCSCGTRLQARLLSTREIVVEELP